MALELVYTSAERGLKAGTSGFCTVAMTRGMPPALVPRLEALGGYRPGPSGFSPKAHCFWRIETAGGVANVLGVVGAAPPDHTQRTNKIAAYLLLTPDELVGAGPAWLVSRPGLVRDCWSGKPAWIEEPVRIPASGPSGPMRCASWQSAAGDAGWAGVVASAFLRDHSRPAHVIWTQGMDPLALVCEVLALLPEWARWRATFSTYFLQTVAGTPCALRFCLHGTPAADAARQGKGLVIDLTRQLGNAPDGRFARMARSGIDEESAGRSVGGAAGGARSAFDGDIELSPLEDEPEPARAIAPRTPRPTMPAAPASMPVAPGGGGLAVRISLWVGGLTVALVALGVLLYAASQPASPASGPRERDAPQPPSHVQPEVLPLPDLPNPAAPDPRPVLSEPAPPERPGGDPHEPTGAPSGLDASSGPERASAAQAPPGSPAGRDVAPAPESSAPAPKAQPATDMEPFLGECIRLRRESRPRGFGAATGKWTGKVPKSFGAARVEFLVPPELGEAGVLADRHVLTVEGSRFSAQAVLEDLELVVDAQGFDQMPARLADALGPGPGGDAAEPWGRLMGAIALELRDASGAAVGRAHCWANQGSSEIRTGAAEPTRLDDVAVLPMVIRIVSPGGAGAAGPGRVVLLAPGESCEIAATALVRVRLDRDPGSGSMRASALALDERDAGTVVQRCTRDLEHAKSLLRQIDTLRRAIIESKLDATQLEALRAAWLLLSPDERSQVAPGSADDPPRTADAMRMIHGMAEQHLRARRDELQRALGELRVRRSEFPKLLFRVSTLDGAVVAERPIGLGASPR